MSINEEQQSVNLQLQSLAQELAAIRLELHQQRAAPPPATQRMEEDYDFDPQIVERPIATDLIPTDLLQEKFPGMCDDFFRSPLDDLDRKRFIHVCPRNVIRQYIPPTLNLADNVGRFTKHTDSQLSEIQRRLAASTRPLDIFMHESLRSNASSVPLDKVIQFVNTVHTLMSDTASYITQLRMDNISRETRLVVPPIPPKTKLTPTPQPLFQDTKAILEHTNLHKAVQVITRKTNRKNQRTHQQTSTNDSSRNKTSDHHNDSFNVGQHSSPVSNSSGPRPKRSTSTSSTSHGRSFHKRPQTPNPQ